MGRPQRRKRTPLVTADHPVALRVGSRRARACASIGQACPHPRDAPTVVRRLYTLLMEKRGPWFALYGSDLLGCRPKGFQRAAPLALENSKKKSAPSLDMRSALGRLGDVEVRASAQTGIC